jgi:hypothetical protein
MHCSAAAAPPWPTWPPAAAQYRTAPCAAGDRCPLATAAAPRFRAWAAPRRCPAPKGRRPTAKSDASARSVPAPMAAACSRWPAPAAAACSRWPGPAAACQFRPAWPPAVGVMAATAPPMNDSSSVADAWLPPAVVAWPPRRSAAEKAPPRAVAAPALPRAAPPAEPAAALLLKAWPPGLPESWALPLPPPLPSYHRLPGSGPPPAALWQGPPQPPVQRSKRGPNAKRQAPAPYICWTACSQHPRLSGSHCPPLAGDTVSTSRPRPFAPRFQVPVRLHAHDRSS